MTVILVTGARGFVGRRLVERLRGAGLAVRASSRRLAAAQPGLDWVETPTLDETGDWDAAVHGVDAVVHLAARAHHMEEHRGGDPDEYRAVNVLATRALAEAAARAGVARFVFVSTIKVNGESTRERPFTSGDAPSPQGAYALTKWEAEQAVHEIANRTGMVPVVVRPPLVYGPGVRANLARLVAWIRRGRPLPLGAVHNRRSLIGVGNLADLLECCVHSSAAANRTFLVSDGEPVSTPHLVREIAGAMGTRARLVPVSPSVLRLAGRLTGRAAAVERLVGSLEVDCSDTRERLGWSPPFSFRQGIQETVAESASAGA